MSLRARRYVTRFAAFQLALTLLGVKKKLNPILPLGSLHGASAQQRHLQADSKARQQQRKPDNKTPFLSSYVLKKNSFSTMFLTQQPAGMLHLVLLFVNKVRFSDPVQAAPFPTHHPI